MERLESFGRLRVFDPDERSVIAVISTGDIARDNAIIEPKGWDFRNYDRNPVILWQHDSNSRPIARTTELMATEKELVAKAQFNMNNPQAVDVFNDIEGGFVNATSVRWLPKKTEVRKVGKGKDARDVLVFLEQELLEWSFVTVPADPLALIVRADGGPLSLRDYLPDDYCAETPYDGQPFAVFDFVPREDLERPYPNEHACRVRPPSAFQPNSFRRIRKQSDGKVLFIIIGKLKGEDTTTTQAYRYPKDSWSADQARAHCKRNEGKTFEPAGEAGCSEKKARIQVIAGRVAAYAAQRMAEPTTDDLIISALMKATGRTEQRIRQELAEGGYR